jgi:hypothetical protein
VIQIKGQSETHPDLSPNDPWARFQILDTILGRPNDKSQLQGSYARRALMDGLEMEEADGINPYRFGMIGASDGHNASSPVEEANFTGKLGLLDGTPQARLGGGREGTASMSVTAAAARPSAPPDSRGSGRGRTRARIYSMRLGHAKSSRPRDRASWCASSAAGT